MPSDSKPKWLRWVRWVVVIVVIVGLAIAVRRSVTQWRTQTSRLHQELSEVESKLAGDPSPRRRVELTQRRDRLRQQLPTLGNVRWGNLAIAGAFYALGLFPPAWLLRAAVVDLGYSLRPRTAIAAQLLGHVGKYVPGKAMVVVLRVGVLRRDQVAVFAATTAVFVETLLMMAIGGCLAAAVLCWLPVPAWLQWVAGAVVLMAGLPTTPPILNAVLRRLSKAPDRRLGWPVFFAGWFYSLAAWLAIAASFYFVVTSMPGVNPFGRGDTTMLLLASTAAISLGTVLGFASLLPGGVGVRELVLTTVLTPAVGTAPALLAAIAARALFMVCEVLLASVVWFGLPKKTSPDASTTMMP